MELKSYQKGDEIQILELFEKSFGKKMSLAYWKWRFLENPFTEDIFIDLMWSNGILVGHYAVSPVEMIIERSLRKTALSMTTMTHPEYGGKGIFSRLAASIYKKLKDNKYEMVWGFPNNNSHYGFKKNLDWKDIGIHPMQSLPFELVLNKEFPSPKYKLVNDFSDTLVDLLNISHSKVHINKTREFLKWRYIHNPAIDYKIIILEDEKAIVVYKIISSFSVSEKFEVDIMEINFDTDINKLKQLLLAIIENEANHSITKFNLWNNLFSDHQILLEKVGFRFTTPLTYLSYRSFTGNDTPGYLSNWELSFGYSDVF